MSGTTPTPQASRGLPIFNREVPRNHTLSWPGHKYKSDWRRERRLVPGGRTLKKVEKGGKGEIFLFLYFLVKLHRSLSFSSHIQGEFWGMMGKGGGFVDVIWGSPVCV